MVDNREATATSCGAAGVPDKLARTDPGTAAADTVEEAGKRRLGVDNTLGGALRVEAPGVQLEPVKRGLPQRDLIRTVVEQEVVGAAAAAPPPPLLVFDSTGGKPFAAGGNDSRQLGDPLATSGEEVRTDKDVAADTAGAVGEADSKPCHAGRFLPN